MFNSFSNPFFLYYSWLELKRYENIFNSQNFYLVPIRKNWFSKVSYLLKSNKYKYSSLWTYENFCFYLKKDKILENALFNIIYPFFQNYYFLNSFPLNRNLSYFLLLNLVFIFLLFIFFL